MLIPKIIHQVWSGKYEAIPPKFTEFAESWKKHHPDWKYVLWDEKAMNELVEEKFPQYRKQYEHLPFDIQRWDVIRYLILFTYGGLYADLDYQCLKPFDVILENQMCCMGMEPAFHAQIAKKHFCIGNALMATVSAHPFFKELIMVVFKEDLVYNEQQDFLKWVVATTGPVMLTDTWLKYEDKKSITFLSDTLVAPFSKPEAMEFMKDPAHKRWQKRVEEAMAIHYYTGTWLK